MMAILACLLPETPARAEAAPAEPPPVPAEAAGPAASGGATVHARSDFTDLLLELEVNGISKGEFFVLQDRSGGYWIDSRDWPRLGVREAPPRRETVGGEMYFSLESVPGLRTRFDANRLRLSLEFPGAALGTTVINLKSPLQPNVVQPLDNSAFLNYAVGAFRSSESAPLSLKLDTELGVRYRDVLFQNTTSSTRSDGSDHTVRLFTNLTHDNRETLQRLVLGDFIAPAADLGSALTMGGVSLSKQYSINPYLIKVPTANFLGAVAAPAEVQVSIDGIPLRMDKLPPGRFDIQNLNYYGGYRELTVVVRDRFGQQQTIGYPYYFTDALLAAGNHEYSYNLGFLREDFGATSNDYGALAASAFHRYGYTDNLSVGAHAAASRDQINIGPDLAYRLDYYGVVTASTSYSRDSQRGEGWAGSLGYTFETPRWRAVLSGRSFSRDYAAVGDVSGVLDQGSRKLETLALVGYNSLDLGSISIGYAASRTYDGVNDEFTSFSYTRGFLGSLSLSATLFLRPGGNVEAFAGLTYTPAPGYTANYLYQRRDGVDQNRAEFQRNLPLGEGYGYSVAVENISGGGQGGINAVAPFVQYNGAHGSLAAALRAESGGVSGSTFGYSASAAGSISYVGGNWNASRPVTDSFAVVKVGDVAGVGVYQNSQFIGATGGDGTVLLPNLGSYVINQVSIDDKDVPFEYELKELTAYVSPPLRSGSLVAFEAKRVRAATGRLKARAGPELKLLENTEFKL
ncbi:MAG TPA: fimbria/pilus outer membrane usher protein, partial [Burkholderiales bacterium]